MEPLNGPLAKPGPGCLPRIAPGRPQDPKLWKAAKEFQAVFLGQFVKAMRSTERDEEFLEPAAGREAFDAMFSEAIGRQMAEGNSLGLTDVIYRQLGGKYSDSTVSAGSKVLNSFDRPERPGR